MQEGPNFIATDLHKSFGPLFAPTPSDETKPKARTAKYFAFADKQLAGKDYLMGSQFTVADGYLFVMLTWAERMKIDMATLPNLTAFKVRVAARPQVQAALTGPSAFAEGDGLRGAALA